MGFFSPKVPKAPDAAAIRAEEEAKLKSENLARIKEQEQKRSTLRAGLSEFSDEEGTISRKALFGE